jgi:hypothetical protein
VTPLVTLAQALGIAYASGISLYATVALLGIAERCELVPALPAPLDALGNPWIVALAFALTVVEFLATLIPGIASAWDAVHTFIRPPAAAAMALLVAWHGEPVLLLAAGLLGGTLGLATHATKLGTRVAVDASPEPATNGMANLGELVTVGLVVTMVWRHPFVTLALALGVLAGMMVVVRLVWKKVRGVLFTIPVQTPPRT